MAQCAGIKRDGGRCTVVVGPVQTHCYQHDPERSQERRRNASRGGKSKGNGELAYLKKQVKDLASQRIAEVLSLCNSRYQQSASQLFVLAES